MPQSPRYDELVATFRISDVGGANADYATVARNCVTKRLDVIQNVATTTASTLTLAKVSSTGGLTTLGTVSVNKNVVGGVSSSTIAASLSAGEGLRLISDGGATKTIAVSANLVAQTLY